jgi:hypothetical protein
VHFAGDLDLLVSFCLPIYRFVVKLGGILFNYLLIIQEL